MSKIPWQLSTALHTPYSTSLRLCGSQFLALHTLLCVIYIRHIYTYGHITVHLPYLLFLEHSFLLSCCNISQLVYKYSDTAPTVHGLSQYASCTTHSQTVSDVQHPNRHATAQPPAARPTHDGSTSERNATLRLGGAERPL